MTDYQTIAVESSGPIVHITLNRPDAANGLNAVMAAELADMARRCDNDATKVVLLTGSGRFFCAGGDLKSMASAPNVGSYIKGMADDLHRAISTFSRMDAVLINVVNGVAAGAGFSLAIAGDLVLAAESASFTMAYTKVGLSPDGSSSYYLPRLVGVRRAQELMLTNRTLAAVEAAEWGLITQIVADAELPGAADRIADQIASGARKSNAAVKALLLSSLKNGLEEQMEIEGRFIAECADGVDGHEGVAAFLAKRPAKFTR